MNDPLFVLAVLAFNVALSEWLCRRTPLRHLGTALLVIVVTAITANVGVIPTVTEGSVVYDIIFSHVAPLAIFWLLLLGVQLKSLVRAGPAMLGLFLAGAAGTVAGVLAGMQVVGGAEAFGDVHHALGGMFVGTYTGGSVNFNAVALHYGVVENGLLYAGATVVDSAMTTLWMAAGVALPRLLAPVWPRTRTAPVAAAEGPITGIEEDTEAGAPDGPRLALGSRGTGRLGFGSHRRRPERSDRPQRPHRCS